MFLLDTGQERQMWDPYGCNVYMGWCAGSGTGSNIAIGRCAGQGSFGLVDLDASNTSNHIIIGNTGTNKFFYTKMSTTGTGNSVLLTSDCELSAPGSSRRYKENIRPFLSGLDYVLKMNPLLSPIERLQKKLIQFLV